MIALDQEELYTLLVGQLRYSLGRQSYIVGTTCDLVRKFVPELSPTQRNTLIADIRLHLTDLERGICNEQPADITDRWQQLLTILEAARG